MTNLRSQLFANQLWETVAFAAKAAFLFFLTPVMLRAWGAAGYGEFALASSVVVFVSMFDLGLRGRARVELCQAVAEGDQDKAGRIMAGAVSRFGIIAVSVFLLVLIIAATGTWSHFLNLPAGSNRLIVITTLFTQIWMLTGFFLEPLVAEGRIGITKLAGAIGAAFAIPSVWLVVDNGGSVALVMIAWLGCLTVANILAPLTTGHWQKVVGWTWAGALHTGWRETLSAGFWFNVTNVTWLLKNHGLIFLISAISGPALAGTLFIILRLSEIVGSFGAIACDVGLGAMSTGDLAQRRQVFFSVYQVAAGLSLLLAFGIGILTPSFWQMWLKIAAPLGAATGWLAACLGLASGLNRIIVYVAMSLRIVKKAAVWSSAEAVLSIVGGLVVQRFFGLTGTIVLAILAVALLWPVTLQISRFLELTFWQAWLPRFQLRQGG